MASKGTVNASGELDQVTLLSSTLPLAADSVIGTCYVLLGVAGVLLNGTVILTLLRRQRAINVTEVQILQLSINDIAQVLLAFPLLAASCFRHDIISHHVCILEAVTVFFCGCNSIWIVTAMSCLRYLNTCWPSTGKVRPEVVWYVMLAVCINSLIWAVSPLLGWGEYAIEPHGLSCSLNWYKLSTSYLICIFSACFVLPLLILAFCYTNIVCRLVSMRRNMLTVFNRHDLHVIKLVFGITVTFLLAWTPYAVIALMYSMKYGVHSSFAVITPMCAKSSAALNPIVYFLIIRRFRQEARCLLPSIEPDVTTRRNIASSADCNCVPELDQQHMPFPGRVKGENREMSELAHRASGTHLFKTRLVRYKINGKEFSRASETSNLSIV